MKKLLMVCILVLAAPLAQAGIVNFMDIADDDLSTSDGGLLASNLGKGGEAGWQPFEWDFGDGLILTVRGFETNVVVNADDSITDGPDTESYAYLDKGNAGMGVCTELAGTQCDPSSDDNVSFGEYLTLSFSKAVTINSLVLNNNHDGGFDDSSVNINGEIKDMVDGSANTISDGWNLAAGEIFTLAYVDLSTEPPESGSRTSHFYLESISVPEPSVIALFAAGLIGLGFARRRTHN